MRIFIHFGGGMTGNRDSSRLGWMLELSMTPASANMPPAISFDEADHLANFH